MFSYVASRADEPQGVAIVIAPVMLLLGGEPAAATLSSLLQQARAAQLGPSGQSFETLLGTLRNSTDPATDHFAVLRVDVLNERALIAFGGTAYALIDNALFTSPGNIASSEVRLSGVAQITLAFEGSTKETTAPLDISADSGAVVAPSLGRGDAGISGTASTLLPLADGVALATFSIWQRDSSTLDVPRETETISPILHSPPRNLSDPSSAPARPDPNIALQPKVAAQRMTGPFDLLFEHTQFHDVETAAVRPDAENGPSDPVAGPQKPTLMLVLPDGSIEPIDRQMLVGRRPSVPYDVNLQQIRLIEINDRGNGLSRTHLCIDPHSTGVMVTDLGSTNGTVLIRASASSIPLTPNMAQFAEVGDQLLLGSAATVKISAQN